MHNEGLLPPLYPGHFSRDKNYQAPHVSTTSMSAFWGMGTWERGYLLGSGALVSRNLKSMDWKGKLVTSPQVTVESSSQLSSRVSRLYVSLQSSPCGMCSNITSLWYHFTVASPMLVTSLHLTFSTSVCLWSNTLAATRGLCSPALLGLTAHWQSSITSISSPSGACK